MNMSDLTSINGRGHVYSREFRPIVILPAHLTKLSPGLRIEVEINLDGVDGFASSAKDDYKKPLSYSRPRDRETSASTPERCHYH